VEGTGADFHIERLQYYAALLRPEHLQSLYQALKSANILIGRYSHR
jgi:hypothetical protein